MAWSIWPNFWWLDSLRKQPTSYDATTGFHTKWRLNNGRKPILMTHHYPDLGSDTSWVRNFCAHFSDVIFRRNQWWHYKMLAVFSGYLFDNNFNLWHDSLLICCQTCAGQKMHVSTLLEHVFSSYFLFFFLIFYFATIMTYSNKLQEIPLEYVSTLKWKLR